MKRKIIKIDEAKCNGCGLCVPSCKEGALQIVNGKARLVSDIYCDGLGACLGECPMDAIQIEERDADEFDERAVASHLASCGTKSPDQPLPCGCPGSMSRKIERAPSYECGNRGEVRSELAQWPIQLALVPANAPYLMKADLVVLADCCAVAHANLHRDFIKGKAILMACPKLDDTGPYLSKLISMIQINSFKSIEVVLMEVPCCSGLGDLVKKAIKESGVIVPLKTTIIDIQ